jgi:hypothetical protein
VRASRVQVAAHANTRISEKTTSLPLTDSARALARWNNLPIGLTISIEAKQVDLRICEMQW